MGNPDWHYRGSDRRHRRRSTNFMFLARFVASITVLVGLSSCDSKPSPAEAQPDPASRMAASERTALVEVKGMHCQACVDAITTGLMKREGVKSVAVDLEGELATVVVRGESPSDEQIREAIDKMGFEAKLRVAAKPAS